jgi:prepilin-type N-terminal cleavage/methylation domain-containing protein
LRSEQTQEEDEMLQQAKKNGGFTLIELLVVVIIVAVLAAVGVPLLSGNVARARTSEAEAGLGSVRTALRAMQAEQGNFPVLGAGAVVGRVDGIVAGDLTGRWTEDADFTVVSTLAAGYCITVNPGAGGAEGIAQDVDPNNNTQSDTIPTRSMDENGTIVNGTTC